MPSSSLMSTALKALHLEKHIITEEQCRRVGEAGYEWLRELALIIAVEPLDLLKRKPAGMLEECKGESPYSSTVSASNSYSDLNLSLCRLSVLLNPPIPLAATVYLHTL